MIENTFWSKQLFAVFPTESIDNALFAGCHDKTAVESSKFLFGVILFKDQDEASCI